MKKGKVFVIAVVLLAVLGLPLFAGGGAQSGGPVTVNVALANNPLSQALARLAQSEYKVPGVTVNISVLPENDLRQRLTTEASTGGGNVRPLLLHAL